jgi:hypothetical protein
LHDLIVDAVYMHRDAELNRRRKHEELKNDIALGIDDLDKGRSAPLDIDDVIKRGREEVKHLKEKMRRSRK